jgi:hypothetical protein
MTMREPTDRHVPSPDPAPLTAEILEAQEEADRVARFLAQAATDYAAAEDRRQAQSTRDDGNLGGPKAGDIQ